jgi:hypothetical protein
MNRSLAAAAAVPDWRNRAAAYFAASGGVPYLVEHVGLPLATAKRAALGQASSAVLDLAARRCGSGFQGALAGAVPEASAVISGDGDVHPVRMGRGCRGGMEAAWRRALHQAVAAPASLSIDARFVLRHALGGVEVHGADRRIAYDPAALTAAAWSALAVLVGAWGAGPVSIVEHAGAADQAGTSRTLPSPVAALLSVRRPSGVAMGPVDEAEVGAARDPLVADALAIAAAYPGAGRQAALLARVAEQDGAGRRLMFLLDRRGGVDHLGWVGDRLAGALGGDQLDLLGRVYRDLPGDCLHPTTGARTTAVLEAGRARLLCGRHAVGRVGIETECALIPLFEGRTRAPTGLIGISHVHGISGVRHAVA